MKRHVFAALAALLAVLSLPSPARAQFDAATVLGRVVDQTGAAVPGATVTLTNQATGITATTVTNTSGDYQFLNVRIGTYRIEAELPGFSKAVAPTVTVTVNARQRVDLSLQVGGVGETVEVTGAIRHLETDSSDRGQVISRAQVVNLPLNGRSYADLALLSPGVRQSSISTSRDASFNVNGMRSALNNFILDGIDNNSYGTSNQGFSNQVVQVSPDAVEEFKVQTNNFSAEFGRAGGAVINATFRSGTNQLQRHGLGVQSQHRAQRDRLLQADLRPEADPEPQPVRRRVRRPDRQGQGVLLRQLRRLPPGAADADVLERADRRRSARESWASRSSNPLTGEVYADGVIPASAITPFARKVLDGLPLPTRAGHLEQLRPAAAPRRQQQQVRHQVRSADQRDHQHVPSLQPPQGRQLRAAAD